MKADVTSPKHPKHTKLPDILRSPTMNRPAVDVEMPMPLLPEVIAPDVRLPLFRTAYRRQSQELRWGAVDARRGIPPAQLPAPRHPVR